MYDYLVIGSGLFGSVCAYELNKIGKKVLVIEKRNHIGGNVYTKNVDGINVHVYGPHIFHTSNKDVWDYINQFAVFNNFINTPLANYKGEVYNLPFNMNTFVKMWPDVHTPEDAYNKIEEEKKAYKVDNPSNLEEQAISLVGPTIYKKLIKGYTEKQWGRDCKELPSFIIKRIPIRYTFNNNYFNDAYQGIPIGGYTQIIEKMLNGIDVKLNFDFFEHRGELLKDCTNVIFTGQIDQFFDYKFGKLEFRTLDFKTETINKNKFQEVAVVNYTDKETPFTRIIEHKHFEFGDDLNKTIITREYPSEWTSESEPYYPINNDKNNELYLKYKNEAIKYPNIYFGGRLGLYKYLDMDKVVEEALNLIKVLKEE